MQGGFSFRKLHMWLKSLNRFRMPLLILPIFLAQPLRPYIEDPLCDWVFFIWDSIIHFGRPPVTGNWHTSVRVTPT
jgi:hypothetical protein